MSPHRTRTLGCFRVAVNHYHLATAFRKLAAEDQLPQCAASFFRDKGYEHRADAVCAEYDDAPERLVRGIRKLRDLGDVGGSRHHAKRVARVYYGVAPGNQRPGFRLCERDEEVPSVYSWQLAHAPSDEDAVASNAERCEHEIVFKVDDVADGAILDCTMYGARRLDVWVDHGVHAVHRTHRVLAGRPLAAACTVHGRVVGIVAHARDLQDVGIGRIDDLACDHVDFVVSGEGHEGIGRGDAGLFEDVNAVAVGLNHRAVKRIACMAHFFGVIVDEHDFVALQHKHLGQLHAGEPGAYYEYSHGGFVRRIL